MSRVRSLLFALSGLICTFGSMALLAFMATVACLFARDPQSAWQAFARLWARFSLACSGIQVALEDEERLRAMLARGPAVLVCNHESTLDVPVLLGWVPGRFAFLSKAEVFSLPLVGWCARMLGCIPLRRGDRADAARALTHAEAAIREGRTVLIFPEGTRSRDGRVAHFKRGALVLAQRTGAPLITIAIDGSWALMPKGALVARPGSLALKAGRLVLAPEPTAALEALAEALRGEVQRLADRPLLEPAEVPDALPAPLS